VWTVSLRLCWSSVSAKHQVVVGVTLVFIGGEDGDRWTGGLDRQIRAMALSSFVGQRLGTRLSLARTARTSRSCGG